MHQKLSLMREHVGGHMDYELARAAAGIREMLQERCPAKMQSVQRASVSAKLRSVITRVGREHCSHVPGFLASDFKAQLPSFGFLDSASRLQCSRHISQFSITGSLSFLCSAS